MNITMDNVTKNIDPTDPDSHIVAVQAHVDPATQYSNPQFQNYYFIYHQPPPFKDLLDVDNPVDVQVEAKAIYMIPRGSWNAPRKDLWGQPPVDVPGASTLPAPSP